MGRTEDETFAVFEIEAVPSRARRRPAEPPTQNRPRHLQLALAVAIVMAIALPLTRVDLDHQQQHAFRWTGCTLLPQACSRAPLMTFDLEVLNLGLLPFTRVGELSRAPYLPRDGFTAYASNDPAGMVPRRPRVQLALAVRPRIDSATIWDVPSRSATARQYRTRVVDLGDGVSATVSKAVLEKGFTETWVVEAEAGHGAVGLTVAVDGTVSRASLAGWTDGNVTSVMRQYLGVGLPPLQTPPSTDTLRTVPEGCTLTPGTCSTSLADSFVHDKLGVPARVQTSRVQASGSDGAPAELDTYRLVAMHDRRGSSASSGGELTRMVLVVAAGDAPSYLLDTARGGRPEWVQREVGLGSGVVAVVSRDYASGTERFHEVWVLRPASGEINHGSIAIEIVHTAGRSGTGQVSAPPGWTDENVKALLRGYLGPAA